MKVLVTGASGRLGSALVKRLLVDGHEVIAFLRHSSSDARLQDLPITIARSALLDRLGLKKWMKGCDGVFHVAGLVSFAERDREKLTLANTRAMQSVLEVAKDVKVPRVVVTSASAVFGESQGTPRDETSPLVRSGIPYIDTKSEGQQIALSLAEPGFDVVVVNPGVILDRETTWIKTVLAGRMSQVYPGFASFVSVNDAVDGHVKAFARGRSGVSYNLCGETASYREVAELVAHEARVSPPAQVSAALLLLVSAYCRERVSDWLKRPVPDVPYALAQFLSRRYAFSSHRADQDLGWRAEPLLQTIKNGVLA